METKSNKKLSVSTPLLLGQTEPDHLVFLFIQKEPQATQQANFEVEVCSPENFQNQILAIQDKHPRDDTILRKEPRNSPA